MMSSVGKMQGFRSVTASPPVSEAGKPGDGLEAAFHASFAAFGLERPLTQKSSGGGLAPLSGPHAALDNDEVHGPAAADVAQLPTSTRASPQVHAAIGRAVSGAASDILAILKCLKG